MNNILIAIFMLCFHPVVLSETLVISDFESNGFKNWQEKEFNGQTEYELGTTAGGVALIARSNGSASGYVREIEVDLSKTPFLNWEWRLDEPLPELDEQTKEGDDYAARLYVIKSGGFFFWKTIALNYVWSSNSNPETVWDNAYAGSNAKMVPVRNAADLREDWISEKRNVYQDLKEFFGEEIYQIDAIAIMSDSDDSGLKAGAAFRNIYFSSE